LHGGGLQPLPGPIINTKYTMAINANGKTIQAQFIASFGASTAGFGMQRRIKITTKNSRILAKPSHPGPGGVGLQQPLLQPLLHPMKSLTGLLGLLRFYEKTSKWLLILSWMDINAKIYSQR